MQIIKKISWIIVLWPLFMQASRAEIDRYHYEAIKPLIKQYERPWTFIELWAGSGELSFKVATKYKKAVCIMAEPDNSDNIFELCKQHAMVKNICAVKRKLTVENLINIGDCEHIDVTFVPDVSRYFTTNWEKALEAVLNFGDYIAIEAPPFSSKLHTEIERFFKQKGGKLFASPPAHLQARVGPLYLFTIQKKYLLKRYWEYYKEIRVGEYTIESNFKEKKLIKTKIKPKEYMVTDWIPGINLFTFKKLLGIWPEKNEIVKMVLPMETIEHNDFRISNLIIQGHAIVPIDTDGKGHENTAAEFLPHLLAQLNW